MDAMLGEVGLHLCFRSLMLRPACILVLSMQVPGELFTCSGLVCCASREPFFDMPMQAQHSWRQDTAGAKGRAYLLHAG